jgi:hypothetical protein
MQLSNEWLTTPPGIRLEALEWNKRIRKALLDSRWRALAPVRSAAAMPRDDAASNDSLPCTR